MQNPTTYYRELILVRIGEIALKGLNRGRFEKQLLKNLEYRLRHEGSFKISRADSRIWIEAGDDQQTLDTDAALTAVQDVFGYVSASPVRKFLLDLNLLDSNVLKLADEKFADGQKHSFKIEVKRVNKDFPLKTYDLAVRLGELILDHFPDQAFVDVHEPEVTFYLEVREDFYLYTEIIPGRKGLPVGMGGRGMLMLSGGIDSPVAGYMMASRGMRLSAVYFHTFPYTSEEAKQKVVDLAKILTRYSGDLDLHIVDFTSTQLALNEACPEDMMTIVMRRMMIRIAQAIAKEEKIPALISGESMGQVASQTLEALACTDRVAEMPIFRPLIGMDKDSTIALARNIGSFKTSILPYEDCCTVFVAKHPKTHPRLSDAERAEKHLDILGLTLDSVQKTARIRLRLADNIL
ncbi:MAG: tRNA uracil 4-sulfurtransferase ThiI [Eubacteriales bacterium]|nr:tRNA 4-thiouridine(8) synthase ThiI [Clostridiales bacterium]MDY5836147.1 tRNA uracil 4-sulfurtransferase ThiI [Eubacteriales bacterium]